MDRVFERAALCGLETEYRDAFGNLRTVEPEVLTRILKALASGRNAADRMLPRSIVIRGEADPALRLAVVEGLPLRWQIFSEQDRKSTRLNSSHVAISYAVFCLKKKKKKIKLQYDNTDERLRTHLIR